MTRVYRDRPGFVRPYWMLAGLCGFGCLLSALTLFPASSGLTAVVGSLALLASGASAAASAALRDLGAGTPVSPAEPAAPVAGAGREAALLEEAPSVGSGVFVGVMSAGS